MKRKLLLLGGSAQQIRAIETAKRLRMRTILCDYLPDNPGRRYADRFYPISTTDKDAVLAIAKEEEVDGVLAYASDPAAPTAAFVAEKLGLPGNPYASVEILCRKDKFRSFLAKHGFCVPKAVAYTDVEDARLDIARGRFDLPVMAKPVDSSGSKGVGRIDAADMAKEKLCNAMAFSRCRRILVEEYVEKQGYQVAGDGLCIDGELVFRCFGNDHFDPAGVNPFVPIAASFPCILPEAVQRKVHVQIQRLLMLLQMKTCTFNFDIRIDSKQNVYLMEVAPRSGGNYIPDVIRYATGIDLAECAIQAAMGERLTLPLAEKPRGFWAYYAVHSLKDGVLSRIEIDPCVVEANIIERHVLKQAGDTVCAFTASNAALGVLLMRFDSAEQMLERMDHSKEWIQVVLR